MLVAAGTVEMKYLVSGSTLHNDFIGILPNGKKCSPQHDPSLPAEAKYCDQCVGVAFASKKNRWIFRCGGRDDTTCELPNIIPGYV